MLREALAALDRAERVVVATVLARHGSAPSTPGQKLALFASGRALGTVGGGAVERVVLMAMQETLSDPAKGPRVETFRLGASLGMCCGGSSEILIEPLSPVLAVLIVGAGHVGSFAAPLLASTGFRVTLVDAREGAAEPERLAPFVGAQTSSHREGVTLLNADYDDPEVLMRLGTPTSRSAFLVMSHDHALDQAAIEWALTRGFAYVGGVGSRAKAARTRARLEAKGFSEADVARVRMPVGAQVHARTPAEIGVAIAAELITWRASVLPAPGVAPLDPSAEPPAKPLAKLSADPSATDDS